MGHLFSLPKLRLFTIRQSWVISVLIAGLWGLAVCMRKEQGLFVGAVSLLAVLGLTWIGWSAHQAIESSQAELQQMIQELQAMDSITDSALANLPTPELLQALLSRLMKAIRADTGGILLFTEDGQLIPQVSDCPSRAAPLTEPISSSTGWAARVLNAKTVQEFRVDTESAPRLAELGIESVLGTQLAARGEVLGLAFIGEREPRTYTDREKRLLSILGERLALFLQNRQLHNKMREAAIRATELNDGMLRRLSHELHDGPAQDLALALLRIDSLCRVVHGDSLASADFTTVKLALESSLRDIRTISSGLHLPEMEGRTLLDAVTKAVRDHERKTGKSVALQVEEVPGAVPLSVKITVYRLIQEALSNSFRHAPRANRMVRLSATGDHVVVEIQDDGPGFDASQAQGIEQTAIQTRRADYPPGFDVGPIHAVERLSRARLGLAGMRERVRVLGGSFQIRSAPGQGTIVVAILPLVVLES